MVTRIPAEVRLSKNYPNYCGFSDLGFFVYRPCFEYFIDPDVDGYANGKHYHGIVVAKMYCTEDLYNVPLTYGKPSLYELAFRYRSDAYKFYDQNIRAGNPTEVGFAGDSVDELRAKSDEMRAMAKEDFDCSKYKAAFTAKAYCFDGDEWDEEVGKRIARQKCWLKYRYTYGTFLDKLLDDLYDLKNRVEDEAVKNDNIVFDLEEALSE